jgi:hypothetical protein
MGTLQNPANRRREDVSDLLCPEMSASARMLLRMSYMYVYVNCFLVLGALCSLQPGCQPGTQEKSLSL